MIENILILKLSISNHLYHHGCHPCQKCGDTLGIKAYIYHARKGRYQECSCDDHSDNKSRTVLFS